MKAFVPGATVPWAARRLGLARAPRTAPSASVELVSLTELPGEFVWYYVSPASAQQQGLGDVSSSWIGTGANQPIAPNALERALGRDQVSSLGQGSGLSGSLLSTAIAAILPELINQLTPRGEVPQQSSILDLGAKILAGLGQGSAGTPSH